MSVITTSLSEKEKAGFLESAWLAGLWFAHSQNSPENLWAGVPRSADLGRFLYEYSPTTGKCRGSAIWSQSLGMAGLLALSKAPHPDGPDLREAAELAAGYVRSLQFLDSRFPRSYGAFREGTPQFTWSFPRDAATGGFGLALLFRETGNSDYLERAELLCEWYRRYGSDESGWPYCFFDLDKGQGGFKCGTHENAETFIPGDWQAGGALAYYYTARVSGKTRWLEEGFRPVMGRLLEIGDPDGIEYLPYRFHGESRLTTGNDDFANVALVAAFLAFADERYLALLRKRLAWLLSLQDEDGSFPNYGSTFVVALELLDYLELIKTQGLPDNTDQAIDALLRAARFGLSLQETALRERRAYGGIYGQSSFGVSRERIHSRDTAYGLHLFLRLAGHEAPCLSAFGWLAPEKEGEGICP